MITRKTFLKTLRTHLLQVRPKEDRRLLGIGMLLMALVCFVGIDTSAKWLINEGMPTSQAIFLRYVVHLVLIVVFLLPVMGRGLMYTNRFGMQIVRALMLLGSTTFNFFAVGYLPLSVTGAIFFVLPAILCALSVPLLGERVGWRRWGGVIIGFVGVLIIIRPGAETFHWATLLSLTATIFVAFYNIFNRKLAGVDSVYTQQFYVAVVATLCVTPFVLGQWFWPISFWGWVAFFAMGIFGGGGHLLLTEAHRYAGASTLAPFIYTQIIGMVLSSWLIFSQPPDAWIWLGGSIVIASGLYIWLRERKTAQEITSHAGGQ